MECLKVYYHIVLALGFVCLAQDIYASQTPTPPSFQGLSARSEQEEENPRVRMDRNYFLALKRARIQTLATAITATKYGYEPRTRTARVVSKKPTQRRVAQPARRTKQVRRAVQPPRTVIKRTILRRPTRTRYRAGRRTTNPRRK